MCRSHLGSLRQPTGPAIHAVQYRNRILGEIFIIDRSLHLVLPKHLKEGRGGSEQQHALAFFLPPPAPPSSSVSASVQVPQVFIHAGGPPVVCRGPISGLLDGRLPAFILRIPFPLARPAGRACDWVGRGESGGETNYRRQECTEVLFWSPLPPLRGAVRRAAGVLVSLCSRVRPGCLPSRGLLVMRVLTHLAHRSALEPRLRAAIDRCSCCSCSTAAADEEGRQRGAAPGRKRVPWLGRGWGARRSTSRRTVHAFNKTSPGRERCLLA